MKLSDLTMNFLGDSITEGAGASAYDKCFVKLIEQKTGAVCNNYGIGGTRIARQKKPSEDALYDNDFCLRIEQMEKSADVIAVFGGTNDFGHGDAPIGSVIDKSPNTFYGALNYLYNNLITRYSDAFIFVITPLHRDDENNPRGEGKKPVDGPLLHEYVAIIKEVAAKYSLPVLDLYADLGICPTVSAQKEKYTVDGLHPNDLGHKIIANMVLAFIKKNLEYRFDF